MLSSRALGGIQQVDLVEDEQPRRRRRRRSPRAPSRPPRSPRARRRSGSERVHHVDDQVGEHRLLERRLERLDELMRELADEADRVGDEVAAPVGADRRASSGRACGRASPRRPTPAPVRAFSSVDLPAFVYPARATVGSAELAAPGSHDLAVSLQRAPGAGAGSRSDRGPGGDRSRSASRPGPVVPIPPPEPLQVGPQAAHPREVVLELGQLDLELALGGVGVVGEDVEDHRRAVDHRHAERRLEVPLLARARARRRRRRGSRRCAAISRLELGELAAPEVAVRDPGSGGPGPARRRSRRRRCAGAPCSSASGSPSPGEAGTTPMRERALAGARVLHAGAARAVSCRRRAALASPSALDQV